VKAPDTLPGQRCRIGRPAAAAGRRESRYRGSTVRVAGEQSVIHRLTIVHIPYTMDRNAPGRLRSKVVA